jgi:regulatory protein
LKVRALQGLAQREHSPVELRGKLLRLAQRGASEHAAGAMKVAAAKAPGAEAIVAAADSQVGHAHGSDRDHHRQDAPTAESAAAQVDTVMAWLTAHGYLSQQRFIESRVNARQPRFGNLRITRELQQHGMALDAEAQQALRASEYDRARDVWQRRYGAGGAPQDAAARVRQMRFLTGRGFSPEVIRRVLRAPAGDD